MATKSNTEKSLNDYFDETFEYNELIEKFIYLTNKQRGDAISLKRLKTYILSKEVGTMLRKYDQIAFNTQYQEDNR